MSFHILCSYYPFSWLLTTPFTIPNEAGWWGVALHVFMILGDLLLLLALAHMLRHQRSPGTTIAWLLAIVLLPQVGAPLYLMLGGRKALHRARLKADIRLDQAAELSDPERSRIDKMLRSYGIPGASVHNRVRLLGSAVEGYEGLVEVIDSAEKTLHVATYIFAGDDVGQDILDRLTAKAEAGVSVRLLIDAFGSLDTPHRRFRPLQKAGGRVAVFSPIINIPFKQRMNLRNHRKIAVADNRIAMAGGMNIRRDAISPRMLPESWLDLSYLIEGPEAIAYAHVFRSDWLFACGEELPRNYEPLRVAPDMDAVTQIVPSGPDVPGDPLYEAIMTTIFDARERLWIVTPYFVPDEALGQALRIACHRGVDVRVYVPKRSNHVMTDIARASFVRDILKSGGSVRYYLGGMMHAKCLVMDNHVAMAGSANFDMRSLFYNYEAMQFFYSDREIQAVSAWIERLDEQCEDGVAPAGMVRELTEGVTRMIAPML